MAKKRNKVPKRIAGLKIPKALRRGIRDIASSQSGKTMVAEAFLAAASMLVAHQAQRGSKTRKIVDEKGAQTKTKVEAIATQATGGAVVLQQALRAFTDVLQNPPKSEGQPAPIAH